MAEQENKTYYEYDPEGKIICRKCSIPLVKEDAEFIYLGCNFAVKLPVCPQCGFVYVPEDLATGRVLSVEKVLEDK